MFCYFCKWVTDHGNHYLVKKKSKPIYLYRTKGTYCGYMGHYQKKNFDDSLNECSAQSAQIGSIIGYSSQSTTSPSKGVVKFFCLIVPHPCSHNMYLCLDIFFDQVLVAMTCEVLGKLGESSPFLRLYTISCDYFISRTQLF